ncbi:MAG: nickel-responsive transcriptional regulator NikR [Proteobacteria bacterium]|nr:nickel-responsive transcriptional regulator NikR [Pseudomonadota bacterium]
MLSRIGISLDEELLEQFDNLIEEKGYINRSEAVRDLIREMLVKREWESTKDSKPRVAVVTIVYDHDEHDLGHKLTHIQHDSHDVIVSTMHVHMDMQNCLEVLILKGAAAKIVRLGNALISTRGVKMGKLILATAGDKF